MSSDSPTRVLLERWHSGDPEALNTLIEKNLPWIRTRVDRRLGPLLRSKGDASDYVQDAMVEFLRYGPRFLLSNVAHFRALLARLIENVLRGKHDWHSAQRRSFDRERPLPSDSVLNFDTPRDAVTRPSEIAQQQEGELLVRLGIALLDPEDQEVLLCRQWDGLSFAEIGERLQVTEDAARMRFNRTLPRLAEKVDLLRKGDFETLLGPDEDESD